MVFDSKLKIFERSGRCNELRLQVHENTFERASLVCAELQCVDGHSSGHSSEENFRFDKWTRTIAFWHEVPAEVEFDEGSGCKSPEIAEDPMEDCCTRPSRNVYRKMCRMPQVAFGNALCCPHVFVEFVWCKLQVGVVLGLQWFYGECHLPNPASQP